MVNRYFIFTIWVFAFNFFADATFAACPHVQSEIEKSIQELELLKNSPSKPKQFFAFGNKNNPITFGFEVEFDVGNSPKLANYYKLPEFKDSDWLNLPLQKRVELIQKSMKSKLFLHAKVLEKTALAPDFLADAVILAEGKNIELAANKITPDLNILDKNVKWVQDNIGQGSFQAHAVFNIEKENSVAGILSEIKFSTDISQAENLEKGFVASEKNGKIPASNFVHPYLPPMDYGVLYTTEERLEKNKKLLLDIRSKRVYGTAYRPDLYGKGKIGFEIRNCHMRLDCIQKALFELSTSIENLKEAPILRINQLGDNISASLLRKIDSDEYFKMLSIAEKIPGHMSLEAKAARFLYPLMEWENHPLILMLEETKYRQFSEDLKMAKQNYKKAIKEILLDEKLSIEEKTDKIRTLIAKFTNDIHLADNLKLGKVRSAELIGLMSKNDLPVATLRILANVKNPEEAAQILKKVNQSASEYNKNRLWEVYINVNLSPEKVIDLFQRLDPKALKVIITELSAGSLLTAFLKISDEAKDVIIKMANYLAKVDPEALNKLFDAVLHANSSTEINNKILVAYKKLGLEKLAKALSSPFLEIENLITPLSEEANFLKYLDLLSGNPSHTSKKWFLHDARFKMKNARTAYNNLVIGMSSKIEPLDASRHIVTIDGKKYLIDVSDERLFFLEEVSSKEKLKKYYDEKFLFEKNAKKTVVFNTNSEFDLRVKNSKDKIILLTNSHHSGVYCDGYVYEMLISGLVRKVSSDDWISHWSGKDSDLFFGAEFKATPEQIKKFKTEVEDMISKKHNFSFHAVPGTGDLNCALFATTMLAKADIVKFSPMSFCSSSSSSQAVYIANEAFKSDAVSAVYLKNHSKEAIKDRRTFEIGGKIGIGVAATIGAGVLTYSLTH